MEELDLKKFLKKYSNTTVDFFRFNGNYGDSLIWHGTMILLKGLNIKVNYVDLHSNIKNSTLFIDGGGNFVDYYSDVRDFLIKKHKNYKNIVILPHTINGHLQKSVLRSLGSNVTIFCRDKMSYNFVKRYATKSKIYIWHDCVFYNNFDKSIKKGKGSLYAFRQDCESIQKTKPKGNIDISYDGFCRKPLEVFLGYIAKHSVIYTDRLHVAIAATLLDKKVFLYPNSYWKNLAVYEYSLKNYKNIVFIYNQEQKQISFKKINNAFNNFLNKQESVILKHDFYDLITDCIKINYKIWELEDIARSEYVGSNKIVKAKKNIDRYNQNRNDLISKIDYNLQNIFKNTETVKDNFYSESPGVLIDRISIFYIKKFFLNKMINILDDLDLKIEYNEKIKIVDRQIKNLGDFLERYLKKVGGGRLFFKVFDPVKIYNDKRIRRYVELLSK